MKRELLYKYAHECEQEYMTLLKIQEIPEYEIVPKVISLEESDEKGFGAIATSFLNLDNYTHKMEMWEDLCHCKEIGKYIVFHEFTHMLDDEKYVKKNKMRYVYLHGYTEYHAAQIEFLKLLGIKCMDQNIVFSMNDRIETFGGERSVFEYVNSSHELVTKLISRVDFPKDIETLKTTVGILFNYYGKRCICKMYSEDYQENVDNSAIVSLISKKMVTTLNRFMEGWFDDTKVELCMNLYSYILFPLIKQYGLV